jgi:hypothetical protein
MLVVELMVTVLVREFVSPPPSVTVRVTWYDLAAAEVWDVVGARRGRP